jgi:hypothetical protein
LKDIEPDFNAFSPFLGDIGHLWSPNFGRKLEMKNQLQIYINQACLRPWRTFKGRKRRVMLKGSQSKAIFMQGRF